MAHVKIAILVALIAPVISCSSDRTPESTQHLLTKKAEARSVYGANPGWLESSPQRDLFARVRDRAYAYCSSKAAINAGCAAEQDEAVSTSIGAIEVAQAQRERPNKEKLGAKEYYVATHPQIIAQVLNTCWALYKEHGAADARILSVCLGNLTDYSPLVPLPVP